MRDVRIPHERERATDGQRGDACTFVRDRPCHRNGRRRNCHGSVQLRGGRAVDHDVADERECLLCHCRALRPSRAGSLQRPRCSCSLATVGRPSWIGTLAQLHTVPCVASRRRHLRVMHLLQFLRSRSLPPRFYRGHDQRWPRPRAGSAWEPPPRRIVVLRGGCFTACERDFVSAESLAEWQRMMFLPCRSDRRG